MTWKVYKELWNMTAGGRKARNEEMRMVQMVNAVLAERLVMSRGQMPQMANLVVAERRGTRKRKCCEWQTR